MTNFSISVIIIIVINKGGVTVNTFKLYKKNVEEKEFDIKKAKKGDLDEKEKMIESLLPFMIKKSKVEGDINEDLLQEFVVGCLDKALKNYDTHKSVKFITFLKYILDSIKIDYLEEYHNKNTNEVSISKDIKDTISTKTNPEKRYITKGLKKKLKEEIDKNFFGRDKYIVEETIYNNKQRKELAKELNISPQRVGQIYYRSVDFIKDIFTMNRFNQKFLD